MADSSRVQLVRPPSLPIQAVREELSESLPPPDLELLKLLGFENYLACLTVVRKERAAGRILLDHAKLGAAPAALRSIGLSFHVAPYECVPLAATTPAAYHEARFVPVGGDRRGRAVVYVGIDDDFALGAFHAEAARQNEVLGEMFGYPDCCIRSYGTAAGAGQDRTANAIRSPGPYPHHLNPVAPLLHGLPLIFHFPCSADCSASLELARRRRDAIESIAPSLGRVWEVAVGIALYGPRVGCAMVTDAVDVGPRSFVVRELVTKDPDRMTFVDKEHPCVLTLLSARRWTCGGQEFSDRAGFAAIFTCGEDPASERMRQLRRRERAEES